MAQSDETLRPARDDDEKAILDLINVVQPHAPWSAAHYDWQFRKGPAGAPVLRVIEIEGRVAAFLAVSRRKVWVKGALFDGFLLTDGMTHPDFRGRGLFNKLAAALRESQRGENLVGLMFPNKHSENSFRRTNWTEIMKVPLCVAKTAQLGARTTEARALEPVAQFDARTGAIWNDAGFEVGVERSPEFLNWRYGIPGVVYHRFMIRDDAGFAVLKVYDRGDSKVINICDFCVRKDALALLPEALDEIHSFAREHGAAEVQAFVDVAHRYEKAFFAKAFVRDLSMDRYIFTDGPKEILATLANGKGWQITQGDNDVY